MIESGQILAQLAGNSVVNQAPHGPVSYIAVYISSIYGYRTHFSGVSVILIVYSAAGIRGRLYGGITINRNRTAVIYNCPAAARDLRGSSDGQFSIVQQQRIIHVCRVGFNYTAGYGRAIAGICGNETAKESYSVSDYISSGNIHASAKAGLKEKTAYSAAPLIRFL